MSKTIVIKLTKAGKKSGPFTIKDGEGNIIASSVPKSDLINGVSYSVNDNVSLVTIISEGDCTTTKSSLLGENINSAAITGTEYVQNDQACLWRHLEDVSLFNSFYGITEPYVLEIPYNYNFRDEILQSIKSYDKVFKYLPDGSGVFNNYEKIEIDDGYFNKLIIYNSQQNSGLLELVKKPKNNLSQYNSYPLYGETSKTITYTKSDGFYQVNNFWDVVKSKAIPQFITDCTSLSYYKALNQSNMDYSKRSYNKSPLRSKDSKVRYILDDRSDIHVVSKFTLQNNQISYK